MNGWKWRYFATHDGGARVYELVWVAGLPMRPHIHRVEHPSEFPDKLAPTVLFFVKNDDGALLMFDKEADLKHHMQRERIGPWAPTGDELKAAGIAQAMENDREAWIEKMMAFIARYAERYPTFAGEDIRARWLENGGTPPHHFNVWGAVMNMAAKRGLVEKTGAMRNATSAATRSHPVTLWRRAGIGHLVAAQAADQHEASVRAQVASLREAGLIVPAEFNTLRPIGMPADPIDKVLDE